MANRPDLVGFLKDLAKRHGARVIGVNLHDPLVATTAIDWCEALENRPPQPDRFRHLVRLRINGRRLAIRANDQFLVIETDEAGSKVPFSVNRADLYSHLLTKRLPIAVGPKKWPVYVAEAHADAPGIDPEALRRIEALHLDSAESLHVAVNGFTVYLTPHSVDRIADVIRRIGPLIDQLSGPGEDLPDFSGLPGEFSDLLPLMASWTVSDDQERSDKLVRASSARLLRLVNKVAPRFHAINSYLDRFRDTPVPESAAALGCLAECAAEAQLLLEQRRALQSRDRRASGSARQGHRTRKRR